MKRKANWPSAAALACLAAALFLVACGGGGGGNASGGDGTGELPPPTPASLAIASGNDQTAAPGTTLAVDPTVIVEDNDGRPVAGVTVSFTVTSGGGSIESTSARTDANGLASAGHWTLGPDPGLGVLSAAVAQLGSVTFAASAARQSPDIQVSMLRPAGGQLVDEQFGIAATIVSTYQLATVTASVAGTSTPLVYGTFNYGSFRGKAWYATLAPAGQPRGSMVAVLTATDAQGHTTDVVLQLVLDRPPRVVVDAPSDDALARPGLHVEARCTDDDAGGCATTFASIGGTALASGKAALSTDIDLSAYEGLDVELLIAGIDSAGQQSGVSRSVHVETSPHLLTLAQTAGKVWDADRARVLYLDLSQPIPALKVMDIATGAVQIVDTNAGLTGSLSGGWLSETGAVFVRQQDASVQAPTNGIYDWQGAAATLLDEGDALRVSGRTAVYATPDPVMHSDLRLCRRDLFAQTTDCLTRDDFIARGFTNAAAYKARLGDVDTAGDIAFTLEMRDINVVPSTVVFFWRGDEAVALPSGGAVLIDLQPVTDGVHVLFAQQMWHGTDVTIEMSDLTRTINLTGPQAAGSYAVGGGYFAYTLEDTVRANQVWRQDPAGRAEQLTVWSTGSTVEAMAGDGSVVLAHAGRRYLAVPGRAVVDIGSASGRVVVRDGVFLVLLSRAVLQVAP